MGNGTISRMLGQRETYYGDYEPRRPGLPRTQLDQREDVFYNGPRLRDYDEELDPKSWGDTMKRHITSPYVGDRRWDDKNFPRFNKADPKLKLYTGTGPYPGETDTDRLSSDSKSKLSFFSVVMHIMSKSFSTSRKGIWKRSQWYGLTCPRPITEVNHPQSG